jgi:hypothetical protein
MTFKKTAALLCAASFGLSSCARPIVPPRPTPPKDYVLHLPYDQIWAGVVSFFADTKMPIKVIDKASGFLASGTFSLDSALTRDWIDCGMVGRDSATALLTSSAPIGLFVEADFNVFVRKLGGDSSAVRVNMTATGHYAGGRTPCVSNGRFEQSLIRRMQSVIAQ